MSEMTLVHVGCGLVAPAGWLNIDRSPNVLLDQARPLKALLRAAGILEQGHMREWPKNIKRHDVTKGLPFADCSVHAIYSSHMLEHLYLSDAAFVMAEAYRVLAPGGILRLALPDGDLLAQELLDGVTDDFPDAGSRYHYWANAHPSQRPNPRQRFKNLFSGDLHRWMPTRTLINRLLSDAGFEAMAEVKYREGKCPDLDTIEHRRESVFVEAES